MGATGGDTFTGAGTVAALRGSGNGSKGPSVRKSGTGPLPGPPSASLATMGIGPVDGAAEAGGSLHGLIAWSPSALSDVVPERSTDPDVTDPDVAEPDGIEPDGAGRAETREGLPPEDGRGWSAPPWVALR
ncbi:MAG TPA: hypothetical protein VHN80_29330 [Kineosporiaceae bacterium]|nr:hypothetical protein [Kineosporiaceae bacterium]